MKIRSTDDFGRELRRRRKQLGLSQEAVADVAGINRRVVGELERGKATVQLQIALEVARAVGLDFELQTRG